MDTERQGRRTIGLSQVGTTALSMLGALGIVVGAFASIRHGGRLVKAYRGSLQTESRSEAPPSALLALRFIRVRPLPRDTVTLSFPGGSALLLVYSRTCAVCGYNMPRWLDLVAELRRSASAVPVYAIDVEGGDSLGTYWPPVDGVPVLTPVDGVAFLRVTGVRGTPTSLVVHGAVLDAPVAGIVGTHRRTHLEARLDR